MSSGDEKKGKILTICVPAYNAEKTLDACLTSLTSYDEAILTEVLVIDDGSTDSTAQIANDFAAKYPDIVTVITKENGGHGSGLNTAIGLARGRYFKNVDSDDTVDTETLRGLVTAIADGTYTEDLIVNDYVRVDAEGGETSVVTGSNASYHVTLTFPDAGFPKFRFTIHNMTIRVSLLRDNNLRFSEHTYFEDCEYMLFPVPYIKTFRFVPDILYCYTVGNPEQSINTGNMVVRFEDHERVLFRLIAYDHDTSMDDAARVYFREALYDIIRTHMMICLVWDQDKLRGCVRAKQFDNKFLAMHPELYRQSRKASRLFDMAAKTGYHPLAIKGMLRVYDILWGG